MSLAIVHSRAQVGVEAPAVTVEVHMANGLPSLTLVGLPETAVKESKDRVRSAILNSARGVSDKDNSPEAQARRRINGFGDLDGVEFVARIDIGTDTNGEDKNEIRAAVTPDHRDYAVLMGAVAPQLAAAPAQGHAPQQPITATQPSQPASAPGAAGRPSWAQ